MASESSDAVDAASSAWLDRFDREPDAAIDDLLLGKVWLGGYAAAEVAQALPQFLPVDRVDALDSALQRWLSAQHRSKVVPPGASAKQYAQALVDAFGLMQVLLVSRTQGWCRERAPSLWAWLQGQPRFPSREARAAFLRALALYQPNRGLLGFWMSLCRQGHRRWVQIALFGLRRMPHDDEGTAESSLPRALVTGLLDYGLALARGRSDVAKKKQWLAELDFLSAVYPMSRERWAARLRESLAVRSQSDPLLTLRHWIDERHPAANQPAPAQAGPKALAPGYWDQDIKPLLERFDSHPAEVRPALNATVDRRLHYAKEVGDSHFLVRTNCRLADFLLDAPRGGSAASRDAAWALDLGLIAASWAPGDPYTWSVVARSLDALGDWPRAQAVFWYARRRFPYNVQAHGQLGHALAVRGMIDEGEAVYRAAILRFPDDSVAWADLGHTLRVAGQQDRALAVYREAQERFHRDPPICTALAGVLIDLGRIDEARSALDWAAQVLPDDHRNQRALADLVNRFKALTEGHPLPPKRLRPRPERSTGDWSSLETAAGTSMLGIDALAEAALWRQRGRPDDLRRAGTALDRAAEVMPEDARWVAEYGLLCAATSDWAASARYFDHAVEARPGDGVLAALRLQAHSRIGESVDWQSLRGRFEELAPVIRVAQDPTVRRPADLEAALAAVTGADGEVRFDELDDEVRQALWVYDSAAQVELADLTQQDFLAARQLTVF